MYDDIGNSNTELDFRGSRNKRLDFTCGEWEVYHHRFMRFWAITSMAKSCPPDQQHPTSGVRVGDFRRCREKNASQRTWSATMNLLYECYNCCHFSKTTQRKAEEGFGGRRRITAAESSLLYRASGSWLRCSIVSLPAAGETGEHLAGSFLWEILTVLWSFSVSMAKRAVCLGRHKLRQQYETISIEMRYWSVTEPSLTAAGFKVYCLASALVIFI